MIGFTDRGEGVVYLDMDAVRMEREREERGARALAFVVANLGLLLTAKDHAGADDWNELMGAVVEAAVADDGL